MLNTSAQPDLGWTSPISGATDEDQGHDSTDHFQIPFQKRLALFTYKACCLNDAFYPRIKLCTLFLPSSTVC